MPTTEEKLELKRRYGEMVQQIREILYRCDPIGLNFGDNPDEYDPEVSTILPRLREATSAADVQASLHQEFVRWFDPETAGPASNYVEAAQEIWRVLEQKGANDT